MRFIVGAIASLAMITLGFSAFGDEPPHLVPPPARDIKAADTATTAVAVLAGGCFWGVQGVFQHVKGVRNAVSGYAGGDKATAEYDAVSSGRTKHAEAVEITYDPTVITYGQLLHIFFSVAHDPTQFNRQGPDAGPQYRSAIFPLNAEQADVAKGYIAQLDAAQAFKNKVVTSIEPGLKFYPAEKYHQDYMTRNPRQPYIVFNDLPKVEALRMLFPKDYRTAPVLVSAAK